MANVGATNTNVIFLLLWSFQIFHKYSSVALTVLAEMHSKMVLSEAIPIILVLHWL